MGDRVRWRDRQPFPILGSVARILGEIG